MIDILIVGLILVALMVYASTKIKKAAAEAYAPETVETGRFRISKPEGFLSVASPDEGLLFRAYSKEFGEAEASSLRRSEATVSIIENAVAAETADAIKNSAGTVVRVNSDADAPEITLETEDEVNDIPVFRSYKLIQNGTAVLQLQISTPVAYRDEFDVAIREFRDSFEVSA